MSAIRVKNLRKKYGSFEALKSISFDVEQGEILGFLGPNGAGKTTTMKILTCFMGATSGEAVVAGYDCVTQPLEVRRRIGYLPENNPLYTDMIVYEYLLYAARLHQVPSALVSERIRRVVEDCGLTEQVGLPISSLSKGYRQRVGLAASMIHDPEILILDEPTVGLDPNQIIEIRTLIKKFGKEKTIILCSHRLPEVELTCNRVIIIDLGKIVASGTPASLRYLVEDHASIRLTIRGNPEKAMEVLHTIPGVKKVEMHPVHEKGARGYDLHIGRRGDLRPLIAKAIVSSELELLDLRKQTVTLEDVFSQVTQRVAA